MNYLLTMPIKIYGGLAKLFNNKSQAEQYMTHNIPSEAWDHVNVHKSVILNSVGNVLDLYNGDIFSLMKDNTIECGSRYGGWEKYKSNLNEMDFTDGRCSYEWYHALDQKDKRTVDYCIAAFDDNLHCWECHGNIESDQEFTFISKIGELFYDFSLNSDNVYLAICECVKERKIEYDEGTHNVHHWNIIGEWFGLSNDCKKTSIDLYSFINDNMDGLNGDELNALLDLKLNDVYHLSVHCGYIAVKRTK